MDLSELDYHLPPESIAQYPLAERDASRLLLLDRATGAWQDRMFRDLPDLLRGDELLVLNNARVLPARLFGRRAGLRAQPVGANNPARREFLSTEIEVLLVRQLITDTWEALVRPGRKLPVGERIVFGAGELEARVESRGEYGLRVLRFTSSGSFREAVARLGHTPLPPYIKRSDQTQDRDRYQTVYAKSGAAVAAPTAGLHFTPEILDRLRAKGIEIVQITLDVGLGTFEPVRTSRLEDHKIHRETYEISKDASDAILRAKEARRPVLAVGTTVVRALEDSAEKCEAEGVAIARLTEMTPGPLPALRRKLVNPGREQAEIFLYPGKPFRVVDQLLTNFHLPQSSLLALVAAFAGRENVLRAYRHAVGSGYRFYSYGDCMLIRANAQTSHAHLRRP
jgi:S-adenosylmethionine:tRNA ribosyltransferase-isomerase